MRNKRGICCLNPCTFSHTRLQNRQPGKLYCSLSLVLCLAVTGDNTKNIPLKKTQHRSQLYIHHYVGREEGHGKELPHKMLHACRQRRFTEEERHFPSLHRGDRMCSCVNTRGGVVEEERVGRDQGIPGTSTKQENKEPDFTKLP